MLLDTVPGLERVAVTVGTTQGHQYWTILQNPGNSHFLQSLCMNCGAVQVGERWLWQRMYGYVVVRVRQIKQLVKVGERSWFR